MHKNQYLNFSEMLNRLWFNLQFSASTCSHKHQASVQEASRQTWLYRDLIIPSDALCCVSQQNLSVELFGHCFQPSQEYSRNYGVQITA